MNKIRLGFIKELSTGNYITLNGRVRIKLTIKRNHIHINVSGSKRLSVLTSIKSNLTRLEMLCVASYVYRQLDHCPNEKAARSMIDTNYAGVFGSLWLGGYE